MNPELQKTHEQILDEINWIWSRAAAGDYAYVEEHAETVLILAKHAKEIVEREKR